MIPQRQTYGAFSLCSINLILLNSPFFAIRDHACVVLFSLTRFQVRQANTGCDLKTSYYAFVSFICPLVCSLCLLYMMYHLCKQNEKSAASRHLSLSPSSWCQQLPKTFPVMLCHCSVSPLRSLDIRMMAESLIKWCRSG